MITLGVVVPCYNEEHVLAETTRRLSAMLDRLIDQGKIAAGSCIYYVDDGSQDRTWERIEALSRDDRHVAGIKLSRHRGHGITERGGQTRMAWTA